LTTVNSLKLHCVESFESFLLQEIQMFFTVF
jgi:hypothetical protein